MIDLETMRKTRDRILREHTPETFNQWLVEKRLRRLIERFGHVQTQTFEEVQLRVYFDSTESKNEFLLNSDAASSDLYEAAPNDILKYVMAA